MTFAHAPLPSGDIELDARRNERLSWNKVVEAMRDLADSPLHHADLARRRYEMAKGLWIRHWLRLCQVTA